MLLSRLSLGLGTVNSMGGENEGRLGGYGSGSGELSICDLTHDGTRFKDVCPATCDACEGSGLGSGSDFTDEIKSLLFKSYLSYEPSTSHFFTKKTHGYKQVEHLPFFNQSSMSKVTNMEWMFSGATSFNRPLHAPWYHEESESE